MDFANAFQIGVIAFFGGAAFVSVSEPGEMLGFVRAALPKWRWLQKLFSCSKCFSFWISIILSLVVAAPIAAAAFSSCVAIVFGSLYDKIR